MEENINDFEKLFNWIKAVKKTDESLRKSLLNQFDQVVSSLAYSKCKIAINIISGPFCDKCRRKINPLIRLNCPHSICSECLIDRINFILDGKGMEELLEKTTCPKCCELISIDLIKKNIPEEMLNKIVEKNGIFCELCKNHHSLKDLRKLSCGHKMNFKCLKTVIKAREKGESFKKNFLRCLIIGCGKPLHAFEILDVIASNPTKEDEKLKEKIMREMIMNAKSTDNENFSMCKKCEYIQIAGADDDEIFCPKCFKMMCRYCSEDPHPGQECGGVNKGDEEQRKQMIIQNHWKICPTCGTILFKYTACNFVHCRSKHCGGKKTVCNNCGIKLQEADEYSHFFYSPFDRYCKLKC